MCAIKRILFFVLFLVLEISTNDYGPHNERLVKKIQNGLNGIYRLGANTNNSMYDAIVANAEISHIIPKQEQLCCSGKDCKGRNGMYATSFYQQWYFLTILMAQCFLRDRSLTFMRPIVHFIVALLIGTLYFRIGNDAAMMLNNFRYVFLTLIFIMFTSNCTMTLICMYVVFVEEF